MPGPLGTKRLYRPTLVDHVMDIWSGCSTDVALTNTWLRDGADDAVIARMLAPTGLQLHPCTFPDLGLLGAVGLASFTDITSRSIWRSCGMQRLLKVLWWPSGAVTVAVIYRPPPSKKNGTSASTFLREFQDILQVCGEEPRVYHSKPLKYTFLRPMHPIRAKGTQRDGKSLKIKWTHILGFLPSNHDKSRPIM